MSRPSESKAIVLRDRRQLMPRRAVFREADVSRAIKGALKAGMTLAQVWIDPTGNIVLVAGTEAPKPADPYQAWKARRDG